MLACIPPPVGSETPSAHPPDAQRCVLNSLGLFALTVLPAPQPVLATTTLVDIAVQVATAPPQVLAGLPPEPSDPDAADAAGEQLVQTASLYEGVRYRWAGMSSRGMDCSGLIARVLQSHGIRAPHNSSQLFSLGRPVSRYDLQPGDLVFFSTRRRGIGHVGLYIGEGKFIHASSGAGRVITTSMDDPYYASRYVGARRLGNPRR
jgi:cell wall-associated NlpC family hydrolase